jgi:hypothetical protein
LIRFQIRKNLFHGHSITTGRINVQQSVVEPVNHGSEGCRSGPSGSFRPYPELMYYNETSFFRQVPNARKDTFNCSDKFILCLIIIRYYGTFLKIYIFIIYRFLLTALSSHDIVFCGGV